METLPKNLPNVIQDAMLATREFILKFLLVNKDCIEQADAQEKHDHVQDMNRVY